MLGNKIKLLTITLLTLLSTVMLHAVDVEYNATVCGSGAYLFGCQELTTSGTYTKDEGGNTVYLHLLFSKPVTVSYEPVIEPGQTYLFGCQTYTPSADVTDNNILSTKAGCDSTIIMNLKVKASVKDITVSYEADIILGQTYLFGCDEITPTALGDVTKQRTIDRVGGGDSIINLTLHVKSNKIEVDYEADIILGQTYLFGCDELTPTALGDVTKQRTIDRIGGGDSIINLTLHVKSDKIEVTYEANIELGQTYLFGCDEITPAAVGDVNKQRTIDRVGGGDSIINLVLHVNDLCPALPIMGQADVVTKCQEDLSTYSWRGKTFTQWIGKNPPAHYRDTLCYDTIVGGSYKNCDTILVLSLTVYYPTYPVMQTDKAIICDGDTYTWSINGKTKSITPAMYANQTTFYDTIPDNPATQQSMTPCDSLLYQLDLTIHTAIDKPATDTVVCNGTSFEWKDQDGNIIGTYTTSQTGLTHVVAHKVMNTAGTFCDSIRYTLNLTVLPAMTKDVREDTVCYDAGDYDWKDAAGNLVKTITSPKASLKDTVYKQFAGTSCDSVMQVLVLFVHNELKTVPTSKKIGFGADFTWYDQDNNVIKTYTDVEKNLTDKYVVSTADGKCDSILYTLSLTVAPIDTEETTVSATVCAGSTYSSRTSLVLITNDTVWSETVRVKKDGVKVDSVYNYNLYIFRNPSILPTNLVDSVRAVCGYPLDTVKAQTVIKDYLKTNFNKIHVDPDAQILWYVKQNGKFVQRAKDIIVGGQDEVEFQCVILDQCGNKLAIDKTIPVLDPDMLDKPGILVEKYGQWLLMLHVNNLVGEGYAFTEQDVDWYQILNGVEKKLDYHGFYYTANEELTGTFYVIINATNASGCNAAIKSNIVDWSKPMNAPVRLVPNFGHEGTMMRLENLNPDNEYQIYAYDEAGMLVRQMSVSGQAMTDIRAEGIPGIYMLRVVTGDKVETLRYIIK